MLFRKDTPLIAPCLAFCAGILLFETIGIDYPVLIIGQSLFLLFITLVSIWRHMLHLPTIVLLLLFISLGFLRTKWQEPEIHQAHFSLIAKKQQESFVKVEIAHCTINEKGNYTLTGKAVQVWSPNHKVQRAGGNIWIWADKRSCKGCPLPGDTAIIHTRHITPVKPETNPFAFNFQSFLKRKKILHQAFVRDDNIVVCEAKHSYSLRRQSEIIKQKALQIFSKHIKGKQELAVIAALVLGHKQWLDEETRNNYAQTGAMHVLAVSGLHTGIVAGIFLIITSFVRSRNTLFKIFRFVTAIGGIWVFALISGLAPSVTRAAIMFTLFLFAKLILVRTVNGYNILACAALILLLLDPYLLYNVGFQLSFTAVLGIFFFQSHLSKALFWNWRPLQKIWELITLSISAQLGTLPFTLYHFNLIPVFGWLTGIWVVPAAGIIMSGSLLLLAVDPWFESAAGVIGDILYTLINWQNKSLEWVSKFPHAILSNLWFNQFELLLFATSVAALAIFFHIKQGKYLNVTMICLALVFSTSWFREFHQDKQTILVHYPTGRKKIIDIYLGEKCFCITDFEQTDEQLKRQTFKHRLAHGIINCQYVQPSQLSKNTFGQLEKNQNFLNIRDALDIDSVIMDINRGKITSSEYKVFNNKIKTHNYEQNEKTN
jgi:competence protein ComEC